MSVLDLAWHTRMPVLASVWQTRFRHGIRCEIKRTQPHSWSKLYYKSRFLYLIWRGRWGLHREQRGEDDQS